jgi:hypothetical protein
MPNEQTTAQPVSGVNDPASSMKMCTRGYRMVTMRSTAAPIGVD